ncbi:hypothetical protein ElyMa_001719800 [Elysia marginata]|uniref:Uncharacterized protein n=1 Tax=Elysia marginata TaxID=1093978 RepID=A0AAV4JUL6_9GAST|nr:hypothetical protein ElyMa_001719800 [Elysia marginata]
MAILGKVLHTTIGPVKCSTAQRSKTAMANRATAGISQPTEVIAEAVRELNQVAMAMLPRASNLKKNIKIARGSHTPLDPINVANFREIPQRYTEANGQNIIILKTGANAPDCIGTVATTEMLNSLSRRSNIWFGEGYFALSPLSFRHICVIHFGENCSYFMPFMRCCQQKTVPHTSTFFRLSQKHVMIVVERG